MSHFDQIAVNVLFNAVLSYAAGLLIVVAVIKFGRIHSRGLKLYLYCLPFVKIAYDTLRGIPSDSYVFSRLNWLALPKGFQRFLSVDLDLSALGPALEVRLAISPDTYNHALYSVSGGDVIYAWLNRVSGWGLRAGLGVCLAVSVARLCQRGVGWLRFEQARRMDRRGCHALRAVKVGFRTVDVYASKEFIGTPFTGGVYRPYICFPEDTLAKLTPAEIDAAMAHEIAHIKRFDVLQSLLIQVLGDVFWFLPFYRPLRRRIESLREVLADANATSAADAGPALASALIKIAELQVDQPVPAIYSALTKEPALIKERVAILMHESRAVFSRRQRLGQICLAALVTGTVASTTFVSNYHIDHAPSALSRFMDAASGLFLEPR